MSFVPQILLAQKDEKHYTVYKVRRCFLWQNQYFQLDIYQSPCPDKWALISVKYRLYLLWGWGCDIHIYINVCVCMHCFTLLCRMKSCGVLWTDFSPFSVKSSLGCRLKARGVYNTSTLLVMGICMHVTHSHSCACMCSYTRACTCVRTCTHARTHARMHAHTHIHTHTHTFSHKPLKLFVVWREHVIHIYVFVYIYRYLYAHYITFCLSVITHTHTHTHTHIFSQATQTLCCVTWAHDTYICICIYLQIPVCSLHHFLFECHNT